MIRNISLGVYYPGHSPLHRLQARTKLLVMLWFVIIFLIANQRQWHFAPYIVAITLVLTAIVLSGISPVHLWRRMRLLVLLALLGALPVVFFPDSHVNVLHTLGPLLITYAQLRWLIFIYSSLVAIFILLLLLPIPPLRNYGQYRRLRRISIPLILTGLIGLGFLWLTHSTSAGSTLPIGPVVITYAGVWIVMAFFTVFLVLYTFSLLLTMTTTPIALIEGLTILLTPLRWLRLPVDDFALMTLIALRFIPTLIDEAEQLAKAQTARGADFSHGSIRERLQSLSALFLPFIHGTLRRAADLATALEARGYEVEGQQTLLHEKSFAIPDYFVLGTVALLTIGSLLL
ncbi:MAG TPA: energy-coupling factor transporter transmembrane component T [Ktedonobacteraceae bacterium]